MITWEITLSKIHVCIWISICELVFYLNWRFYKRFRCCKTIQSYFEPQTNLSEHDAERTRFSLSNSRVILEPEGDRRNSDDPYNQAIQVVVTFNSINAKPQPIEQFVKETHQKMMTNEFRSEFKVNSLFLFNCQSNQIIYEHQKRVLYSKVLLNQKNVVCYFFVKQKFLSKLICRLFKKWILPKNSQNLEISRSCNNI